ncbi:hypothetical protein D3C87_1541950 [compost metagenome]
MVGHTRAGLADNHGMHRLTPFVAGDTDHGALGDVRMTSDGVLDFGGEDVLAATDDHVLETVADVDEAVLIHIATVTGVHPAAAQRFGSRFGFVPVTEHDVRSPCDDFTHGATRHFAVFAIDDAHLDAIEWPPCRVHLAAVLMRLAVIFGREHADARGHLGHAVALLEICCREGLAGTIEQRG